MSDIASQPSLAGAIQNADASMARHPARIVFEMPEIIGIIVGLLPRQDLESLARVNKAGLVLAAQRIYHRVSYAAAASLLYRRTDRRNAYTHAVKIINAHHPSFSSGPVAFSDRTLREMGVDPDEKGWKPAPNHYNGEYAYHPDILAHVLRGLRQNFPHLLQVDFSLDEDSWTAYLDCPSHSAVPHTPITGQIHFERRATFDLLRNNPPSRPSAPDGLIMKYRLTPTLYHSSGHPPSPADRDRSAVALKNAMWVADLGEIVNFEDTPLTLGDLGSIYARQIGLGRHENDRVSWIAAADIFPFDISDFSSFALLAANSLSCLELKRETFAEDMVSLSFEDLPILIRLIRRDLPRLGTLTIELKGVESAERVCQTYLSGATLEEHGPIASLTIITKPHPGPLWHTLRVLAPLLFMQPLYHLHVGSPSQFHFEGNQDVWREQTDFLRYLRSQPRERRVHLSTVDFPSLGLSKLPEVQNLGYRATGEPRTVLENRVAGWGSDIQSAALGVSLAELFPLIEAGMQQSISAAGQLENAAPSATDEAALEGAERLLEAVDQVRDAATRIAYAVPITTVREIVSLVKELKGRVAAKGPGSS